MSERLEEIREQYKYRTGPNASNVKWLIEQAEQKERFEKLHENYVTRYTNVVSENNEMNEENTRLREALKFYANSENYQVNVIDQWGPEINIMKDGGNKASQVLEESK